jgi:hypothetical protein
MIGLIVKKPHPPPPSPFGEGEVELESSKIVFKISLSKWRGS